MEAPFAPDASAAANPSRWIAATMLAAMLAAATAWADDPPPAAIPPAFQPGEISIGEPIPLPLSPPPATVGDTGVASAPVDDPRAALPPTPAQAAPVPGSGWIGLAVAESAVPGRWRIEEVTADGPAARAGVVVGDELRAVNGVPLSSPEQVSQALTAIAAGQDVRVAVARADRVSDVVLRAEPRPAARAAEPSRFVPQPTAPPEAVTPTPAATSPAWQAAGATDPVETGSRFSRAPGGSAAVPTPAAETPPPAVPRAGDLPGPVVPPPAGGNAAPGRIALGVRTVPIDPTLQARFNLSEPAGAYVIGVVQDLPAAKAGVPPGSVIVALGDQPVRSPVELTRLVTSGPLDRPVAVQFLLPGGATKRAEVVLQSLDAPLERALTGDAGPVLEPPAVRPGPVPRRAERRSDADEALRTEIRGLRARLDRLERLLESRLQRGQ